MVSRTTLPWSIRSWKQASTAPSSAPSSRRAAAGAWRRGGRRGPLSRLWERVYTTPASSRTGSSGAKPRSRASLSAGGKGTQRGSLHEQVGVGPEGGEDQVPVPPVQGGGDGQGQPVGGEEVQQPAHGQLLAQGLVDGLRPPGGDPPDLGELLGVLLDDGEDLLPEGVHQPPGGGGRRCHFTAPEERYSTKAFSPTGIRRSTISALNCSP